MFRIFQTNWKQTKETHSELADKWRQKPLGQTLLNKHSWPVCGCGLNCHNDGQSCWQQRLIWVRVKFANNSRQFHAIWPMGKVNFRSEKSQALYKMENFFAPNLHVYRKPNSVSITQLPPSGRSLRSAQLAARSARLESSAEARDARGWCRMLQMLCYGTDLDAWMPAPSWRVGRLG